MTAWNAESFIAEALDSALTQTRPPDELVVNDDGSTDGTVEVVQRYGGAVTLLTSEHAGQSAGKNRALAQATGDFIAPLDADDVWLPHHLERLLGVFDDDPSLDAAFGATDEFVDAGGSSDVARVPRIGAVGPLLSGALLRRSLFDRVGGFRSDIGLGDWIDWWSRATSGDARFLLLDEVLTRRRLHRHNTTIERAGHRGEYLRVMRDRLAAKRGSEAS
jgi:glycosyltransferase involved in cell wall biosynthesis